MESKRKNFIVILMAMLFFGSGLIGTFGLRKIKKEVKENEKG